MNPYLRPVIGLIVGAGLALTARSIVAQQAAGKPGAELTGERRIQIIDAVVTKLNTSYVFPETAKRMEEAIRKRTGAGDYEKVTSGEAFAQALTRHLQEVSRDKHLRVRYSPEPLPERGPAPSAEEREKMKKWAESVNYGFEKVEILPGNIGYIELRGFLQSPGFEHL